MEDSNSNPDLLNRKYVTNFVMDRITGSIDNVAIIINNTFVNGNFVSKR